MCGPLKQYNSMNVISQQNNAIHQQSIVKDIEWVIHVGDFKQTDIKLWLKSVFVAYIGCIMQ